MQNRSNISRVSQRSKIIFVLSILVSAFWYLGKNVNVYRYAFIGAVFEILWLPMLGMLCLLPLISLFLWVREKFSIKSLYLYAIILLSLSFFIS